MTHQQKIGLLSSLCALVVTAVFLLVPPMAQDLVYHHFADPRSGWGVPNVGDVLSNAPLMVVGLIGLWVVHRRTAEPARLALQVFFAGVVLVAPGSAYYHWMPDNETLFWDRLPMTIAFMGLTAAVIVDRVDAKWGNRIGLPVLVIIGLLSVVWWRVSESLGVGDLRAYALVQFLSMAMIPLMLWLFPDGRTIGWRAVGLMLVFYGMAKVTEHFDAEVLALLNGFVSGHSIKHVLAAFAPMALAMTLWLKPQGLTSSLSES